MVIFVWLCKGFFMALDYYWTKIRIIKLYYWITVWIILHFTELLRNDGTAIRRQVHSRFLIPKHVWTNWDSNREIGRHYNKGKITSREYYKVSIFLRYMFLKILSLFRVPNNFVWSSLSVGSSAQEIYSPLTFFRSVSVLICPILSFARCK